jgi:ATP-binding cassette, subfamily A (ABC1), member 3
MVSGVSVAAYWISNLFTDYIKHIVPSFIMILMCFAFNVETFTDTADSFWSLSLLFILYGWGAINFSYLTGWAFKNYGNAQVATFFINFILVKKKKKKKKKIKNFFKNINL